MDAEVIVIGLGAIGSAATWQLARRGVDVLGLELFELGHARGASHGDSRIIRLSYHTAEYVRAAGEAYADWALLEADCRQRLVTVTGGVDIFPPGAAIPIEGYTAALTAAGVPFEVLDAGQGRRLCPALLIPDAAQVLVQSRTGFVPADRATRLMRTQAAARGARLREHCPVKGLREVAGGVEVRTASGPVLRARTAVLACDAWTNRLLAGLGVSLPLTVTREHAVHFQIAPDAVPRHRPGPFRVWIWMDDPSYYGFPCLDGSTLKVGQDCGGEVIEPGGDGVGPRVAPDREYVQRVRGFVAGRIPAAGPVARVTTCRYTLTPDRDFVLGPVPGHERVLVALGAAHGFKFAPWFGRVLADLVTSGTTSSRIGAFAPDRVALRDPDQAVRWLV